MADPTGTGTTTQDYVAAYQEYVRQAQAAGTPIRTYNEWLRQFQGGSPVETPTTGGGTNPFGFSGGGDSSGGGLVDTTFPTNPPPSGYQWVWSSSGGSMGQGGYVAAPVGQSGGAVQPGPFPTTPAPSGYRYTYDPNSGQYVLEPTNGSGAVTPSTFPTTPAPAGYRYTYDPNSGQYVLEPGTTSGGTNGPSTTSPGAFPTTPAPAGYRYSYDPNSGQYVLEPGAVGQEPISPYQQADLDLARQQFELQKSQLEQQKADAQAQLDWEKQQFGLTYDLQAKQTQLDNWYREQQLSMDQKDQEFNQWYSQQQLGMDQAQLDQQRYLAELQAEQEKEQNLAALRAKGPASWLEYALAANTTPTQQRFMTGELPIGGNTEGLLPGSVRGQAIQGWQPLPQVSSGVTEPTPYTPTPFTPSGGTTTAPPTFTPLPFNPSPSTPVTGGGGTSTPAGSVTNPTGLTIMPVPTSGVGTPASGGPATPSQGFTGTVPVGNTQTGMTDMMGNTGITDSTVASNLINLQHQVASGTTGAAAPLTPEQQALLKQYSPGTWQAWLAQGGQSATGNGGFYNPVPQPPPSQPAQPVNPVVPTTGAGSPTYVPPPAPTPAPVYPENPNYNPDFVPAPPQPEQQIPLPPGYEQYVGMARGGMARGPQAMVVGEKGPEMEILPPGQKRWVIPFSRMPMMANGGYVTDDNVFRIQPIDGSSQEPTGYLGTNGGMDMWTQTPSSLPPASRPTMPSGYVGNIGGMDAWTQGPGVSHQHLLRHLNRRVLKPTLVHDSATGDHGLLHGAVETVHRVPLPTGATEHRIRATEVTTVERERAASITVVAQLRHRALRHRLRATPPVPMACSVLLPLQRSTLPEWDQTNWRCTMPTSK